MLCFQQVYYKESPSIEPLHLYSSDFLTVAFSFQIEITIYNFQFPCCCHFCFLDINIVKAVWTYELSNKGPKSKYKSKTSTVIDLPTCVSFIVVYCEWFIEKLIDIENMVSEPSHMYNPNIFQSNSSNPNIFIVNWIPLHNSPLTLLLSSMLH